LVKALDRSHRLAIGGFSHPSAAWALGGLSAEARASGMHVVDADGVIHSAGAAVAPLLRSLPAPAGWLGTLCRISLLQSALEAGYGVVARHRSRLARFVPDCAPVTVGELPVGPPQAG
jgi:predicted DCC family thiol-disulfide oxidoreductase YuxK